MLEMAGKRQHGDENFKHAYSCNLCCLYEADKQISLSAGCTTSIDRYIQIRTTYRFTARYSDSKLWKLEGW